MKPIITLLLAVLLAAPCSAGIDTARETAKARLADNVGNFFTFLSTLKAGHWSAKSAVLFKLKSNTLQDNAKVQEKPSFNYFNNLVEERLKGAK